MMIILAIFQLIHLKVTSTRNIKKYEKILQDQADEFKLILAKAKAEREQLEFSRKQLSEFQKNLNLWHSSLQHTTSNMLSKGELPEEYRKLIKSPKIKVLETEKKINWVKIMIWVVFVMILVLIVVGVLKFFVWR